MSLSPARTHPPIYAHEREGDSLGVGVLADREEKHRATESSTRSATLQHQGSSEDAEVIPAARTDVE